MKNQVFQVEELPDDIDFNSTFEITTNNVSYFTHGFFKYPCKFIPQIPRWAILKYTKEKQLVLDPFAGSGTTLVEAVLNKRNALGVDFDKLSQLLCKTKTCILSEKELEYIKKSRNKLFEKRNIASNFNPDIHNINHWFPRYNINQLLALKEGINSISKTKKNERIINFLLVCFASIIKKCSYADDTSPKPYVSTRFKKEPLSAKEIFFKTCDSYLKRIEEYKNKQIGDFYLISEDAREIDSPEYDGRISLAVTSPPYINAFDYVRSLRLENAWLDFYGDSNIIGVKKKQVGTETISSKIYTENLRKHNNKKLDDILSKIYKRDKKRAFVVLKFFEDMEKNFNEVNRLLKDRAHYVVVVGDSKIKGIDVPTHEILIDIAKKSGFKLENMFSYIIKNRYLRIPRAGRGGLIKKDWVVDLVKING
jgi:DNA modification methylase